MARDPALPILSAFPYEDVSKLSSSEKEEAGRDLRNATLSENKVKLKCRICIGVKFYHIGPDRIQCSCYDAEQRTKARDQVMTFLFGLNPERGHKLSTHAVCGACKAAISFRSQAIIREVRSFLQTLIA